VPVPWKARQRIGWPDTAQAENSVISAGKHFIDL